jgi:hypothetical protein
MATYLSVRFVILVKGHLFVCFYCKILKLFRALSFLLFVILFGCRHSRYYYNTALSLSLIMRVYAFNVICLNDKIINSVLQFIFYCTSNQVE